MRRPIACACALLSASLTTFAWAQTGRPPAPAPAAPPTMAAAPPAAAAPTAACPGNPNALGVARVVEIDTTGGPGFGWEHFKMHDFLRANEVLLTFDDGPWQGTTPAVLKALADHCVRATFFPIGKHATYYPEILKQVAAAGHTIGSHTWSTISEPSTVMSPPGVGATKNHVVNRRGAVRGGDHSGSTPGWCSARPRRAGQRR